MFVVLINGGSGGVVGTFGSKALAEQYLAGNGWLREERALVSGTKLDSELWLKEKADGSNTFTARVYPVISPH